METNDSNSVKMKLNHHMHSEAEYYTTTLFFDEEKNLYSLFDQTQKWPPEVQKWSPG